MATLLESIGSQMTPDMVGTIGKAIGVDNTKVQEGLQVVGPLVQDTLAERSKTTAGMDSIMKMLPQDGAAQQGGLTDLLGLLGKGPMASVAQSGLLNDLFGQGASSIGKVLSSKLGFDVTPILAAAIPAVIGAISKAAKEQNLDSQGIAKMLQTEQANYVATAKPEVLATLSEAKSAAGAADSLKATFTNDEWLNIRLSPTATAFYVVTSSPSGPVGMLKELSAAGDLMKNALKDAPATSLVNVAFGNALAATEGEKNIDEKSARPAMLDAIRDAAAAVKSKTPAEYDNFASTLKTLAASVANASKEGGFLGIGAKTVSKQEQQALDEINAALA
jgi:hypothetical protein